MSEREFRDKRDGRRMFFGLGNRAKSRSHAVGVVSRFMENPRMIHERATKRIVKYIKKTLNFGILYTSSKSIEAQSKAMLIMRDA